MAVTVVTEPRGFSLSSEVRQEGFSKARAVNATLIEPYPILNASDCNNSYFVNNSLIEATLLSCSNGKLTLNVTQASINHHVDIELRGYFMSSEDEEKQGQPGLYVSGVGSSDSVPLNLNISHIGLVNTTNFQEIVFYITHPDEMMPRSQISLYLHKSSETLEFHMELNQLLHSPLKPSREINPFMNLTDITLNWVFSGLNNSGVFYTDANAYKFVKRNVHGVLSKAASFYPVNSGIFIEKSSESHVVVMNDRPMAASAYSPGRIEFIILRQTKTTDGLGIDEPVIDWSPDGKGINYTATFKMLFAKSKDEIYRAVQKEHVKATAHTQFFFGGKAQAPYTNDTPLKVSSPSNTSDVERKRQESFVGLMDKYGIMDVQLLPPAEQGGEDFYMRVTRMSKNSTEFKPESLLSELCDYHRSEVCKMMGIKRTQLDTRIASEELPKVSPGSQAGMDIEMYRVSVSLFKK